MRRPPASRRPTKGAGASCARPMSGARERRRKRLRESRKASSAAAVRYFLDTEFNGFGGALLSLALVPVDGEEFYVTLECADPILPWVERNVVPFLDHVPVGLVSPRMKRAEAAMALSAYLAADPEPELVADWPEDLTQFCALLMTGPGLMVPIPALTFRLV